MIGPFDVNRHKFLTKRKKLKFGLEICLVLRVLRYVLITRKDFLRQIKVDPGLIFIFLIFFKALKYYPTHLFYFPTLFATH